MSHPHRVLTAVLLLLASACGDDAKPKPTTGADDAGATALDAGNAPPSDAGSTANDAGSLDAGAADSGPPIPPKGQRVELGSAGERKLVIGPIAVASGDEATVCIIADLGNDEPMPVRSLISHLGEASHHMIAYRTDEAVTPEPVRCGSDPFSSQMLNITQSHDNELVYPAEAILMLEPHQHIKLEMHYFNSGATATELEGSVQFVPDPNPTDGLAPVKVLFDGDISLSVPSGVSTATHYGSIPSGAHVFALATHTHQWGTLSTLSRVEGPSDASPTQIYESQSWSEPPLGVFEPALTFATGEGLLLSCTYDNLSGGDVSFGTSANDEMCFFWAFYY